MDGLHLFTVLLLPSIVSAQTIINNTLYEDQFACPGTEVVFTCELIDSQILSWISEVLIGSGGEQIQFFTGDQQGTRRNSSSNQNTFAILTVNDNVPMRLVSELHVMVPLDISDISVSCNDVVSSMPTTKSFTVLGQPNVPQDVFASQLECRLQLDANIAKCPNTYFWRYSPMNATQAGVDDYDIFVNGVLESNHTLNNLTTNTGARISSLFNVTNCDVRMFSVSAVNVCGRRGERSSDLMLNPQERVPTPSEFCLTVPSGAAYQDCALPTLLVAVIIAVNFAHI